MERHRKILEFALSSLFRRKFKNFGIVVIFSLVVATLASILFLTFSLKREASNLLTGAPELIVQKTAGGRHDLIPLKYGDAISQITGVGEVVPRYWGYYYDSLTDGNYTVIGHAGKNPTLPMLSGRLPIKKGECAIGKGIADARMTGLDNDIFLVDGKGKSISYHIVGIFQAKSKILTNDLIVLSKEDALTLLGIPLDRATDIVVTVFNESEVNVVARKIRDILPDTRPIMREEIIRTYDSVFNWRSGMTLTMFMGALLAFCILAWDKATGLSAEEKREIGILKAIGWETSDILELKLWEGTAVSLTSLLTGLIAAYIHVFLSGAGMFRPVLSGWSVLFPGFHPIPYIDPYQIFSLMFCTVVPYVASTIIPTWKAAITDPDAIMRV